jgi:hypothetical protein
MVGWMTLHQCCRLEFASSELAPPIQLDSLSRMEDHAARAPPWTLEVGCGGLVSSNMEAAFRENKIDDTVVLRLTAIRPCGLGE